MEGNWQEERLTCPNCGSETKFRVAFKKAQHLNGKNWQDIVKSAEIVLCSHCGASIYISSIKQKAEL